MAASTVLAADSPAEDQAAQLERLSTTIDNLKTKLTAIREGLEGMRSTPQAVAGSPPDPVCAPAAKSSCEPQVEAGELDRLRSERTALKDRIAELEQVIKQARTGEAADVVAKGSSAAPIETAAAAELNASARGGSAPKASEPAVAADAAAGADSGTTLQLRAELALAQRKITDLNEELQSTRANQASLEAEVKSLRSLTDAKIKRFMGWQ